VVLPQTIISKAFDACYMSGVNTQQLKAFEQWSPRLFLIAGTALLINFVLLVFERFAGLSTPGVVGNVLILFALTAAAVGLLGLYPQLAGQSPWLALVSAIAAGVAGVGFVLLFLWVIPARLLDQSLPPGILLVVTVAMLFVGFLLFGITSLRTAVPSRTVGFLLLAVVGILLVYLAGQAVYSGDTPAWVSPAVTGLLAVVSLALGYVHKTDTSPSDRAAPAP
jgi:hypothetical protein